MHLEPLCESATNTMARPCVICPFQSRLWPGHFNETLARANDSSLCHLLTKSQDLYEICHVQHNLKKKVARQVKLGCSAYSTTTDGAFQSKVATQLNSTNTFCNQQEVKLSSAEAGDNCNPNSVVLPIRWYQCDLGHCYQVWGKNNPMPWAWQCFPVV